MNRRTKVFLVDDHPVFRHGLRQMIQEDVSFVVVGDAGDDEQAFTEIPRTAPEIVIVDIHLPKQGGLELVRRLQALPDPPACVMLTMYAEEGTCNAALDAGARGYILKEDAMELVLLGLRAVAAGALFISPTISNWLVRRRERAAQLKEKHTGLGSLTATERCVLQLVAQNKTNKQIAGELFISHRTVESHRASICQKLGLQGVHKLLQFAIEHRSELA